MWYNTEAGSLGQYVICTGGSAPEGSEDPNCSDSVEFWDYSVEDHRHYLGFALTSCAS